MKELLITGFEPFGGDLVNPSWEAVSLLPEYVGDCHLTKLRIPVVFGEAAKMVVDVAESVNADVVLCIGLAANRSGITPEFVGINLRHGTIPDNAGTCPKDTPIIEGGVAAYFSTVPSREMIDAITAVGISASPSYSAGTYVCNDVLYSILARFSASDTKAGFIHVPCLPEYSGEGKPGMALNKIVTALEAAIKVL